MIVWIHGGGMYGGTAAVPVQDGANLARHGAVVVTINYRLGIFGFFSHPELSRESPRHVSGNQGILDQLAALRWVRDNIAAFGGDPDRVTIAGNSSGGESVGLLVASPMARGLFQRAIAESGNDAMPINPADAHRFNRKAAAEANGLAFAKTLGAEHLADLRKLSVEDLKAHPWLPRAYVDGYLVVSDLTTLYRGHRQNDVPLLVGWNADEGKDLAPEILETGDFTAARHKEMVTKLLGHAPSKAILAAYPGDTDAQARASINRLTNDWWGWRMAHWAGLQHAHGRSKAYVYYFAHMPAQETPCYYGCGIGHGAEIQYVFDNLDTSKRDWTTQDRQRASQLADAWVRFAATGDPNGAGLEAWPAYDGEDASILRIGGDGDGRKGDKLPDFDLFR